MKVNVFEVGVLSVNCYVISCEETKKACIVDPGGYSCVLSEYINKNQLDVEFILLTHGHGDHFGGLHKFAKEFNAPIYAHEDEKGILNNASLNFSTYVLGTEIAFDADRYLKDNEEIKLGNLILKVIHTPGHSPGGICILVNDCLISGDTLFNNSVGRTDFPYSSTSQLVNAVKNKLFVLDDDIRVFPGHGPETSIGYEKKYNPFIR